MKITVEYDDGRIMEFRVANELATEVYQIITDHFAIIDLNGKSLSELLTRVCRPRDSLTTCCS